MPREKKKHAPWFLIDLPLLDYERAWKLQTDMVAARMDGAIGSDVVIFLEHPPVFTLGRRGGIENLCVPRKTLDKKGISVVQVERGGNITYHGPGQLTVYFIVHIESLRLGVKPFVSCLEEIMIRGAGDWGIRAERNPLNPGIWVKNNKLGSIGIAVRKGITFHGFALNVNVSMDPFSWINPCGLDNVGMTSIKRERSAPVPMEEVRTRIRTHLENVFHIPTVKLAYPDPKPGMFSDMVARIQNPK